MTRYRAIQRKIDSNRSIAFFNQALVIKYALQHVVHSYYHTPQSSLTKPRCIQVTISVFSQTFCHKGITIEVTRFSSHTVETKPVGLNIVCLHLFPNMKPALPHVIHMQHRHMSNSTARLCNIKKHYVTLCVTLCDI